MARELIGATVLIAPPPPLISCVLGRHARRQQQRRLAESTSTDPRYPTLLHDGTNPTNRSNGRPRLPLRCVSPPSISPSRRSTNRTHSTLSIPFPTARLANIALTSISVDAELSPLVRRTFALEAPSADDAGKDGKGEESVLRVEYKATTNRMLRVATNAFMESLKLVVEVMERMDVGVLGENLQKEVEAAA